MVCGKRCRGRPFCSSMGAVGTNISQTRRGKLFLDVVVAAVVGTPTHATAKGGNPYLLLQDGMEAFKRNRVEESVNLFDNAAVSGYPKATVTRYFVQPFMQRWFRVLCHV